MIDISFLTKSVLDELTIILHPKTPQTASNEAETEAESYIRGSGVNYEKLTPKQIELWSKFYIQFRLYNIAGYEEESKGYLNTINAQLTATYKAQNLNYEREKDSQETISSTEVEVFNDEFWTSL